MVATSRSIAILFALLMVLTFSVPISAQQNELRPLLEKVGELIRAQKYAEATPLAERSVVMLEKALGPDHPVVAEMLYNLGELYRHTARYTDAEVAYKRMLAIREKTLGPGNKDVAPALDALAQLYRDQNRFSDAERIYKRALTIREAALGPNNLDVAQSLNRLAVAIDNQARYAEAEPLYKRALAIREAALGPNHPDVAQVLSNLANLYDAQGRFAEAEQLQIRALAIRETALGPNHIDVGRSLNNLSLIRMNQGRYREAEPLVTRALAISEHALGAAHPEVALMLNNLGQIYKELGRYVEAEPPFRRALAIRESVLGGDHPDVAQSLNNLAGLYSAQGRYADAESLLKRALAIYKKAHGPDHPEVARVLINLADAASSQGRYAEAEAPLKRALAIYEQTLGPNHDTVAAVLNNLAELDRLRGRDAEAEPLLKRSLAIRERALGPDHPNLAVSLNNLADFYHHQARYADAESLYKRTLAIQEKALGPDHAEVARSLSNLAALYEEEGRSAEVEPLYQRALAINEKALGAEHPDVAIVLANLAVYYANQGRHADAERLLKRSLEIREKTLGPDHPHVATSVGLLADLYRLEGRFAEVEPLYKRALAIRERTLGPDHPDVAADLNRLADFYASQGRAVDALPLVQTTLARGRATISAALPVLFEAQKRGLIAREQALDDALNVAQRSAQTSAATAVSKLAVRLAAGSDRLSQLVREDQDLVVEAEALDQAIIAAVSKEPGKRDPIAEQRIRDRLAAIARQRDGLRKVFAAEFPDFAALSNPEPLRSKDAQSLLATDEVLLAFALSRKETYVFALTSDSADWQMIPVGAPDLAQKVAAFRRGLDVLMAEDPTALAAAGVKRELFDLVAAQGLYAALIGPVEALVKDKRKLIIVPAGPLTALPFHLLVTEKPKLASPAIGRAITEADSALYRSAAWLIVRQAVSVEPSIGSLRVLRTLARKDHSLKPMIGFGDPVFGVESPQRPQSGQPVVQAKAATRAFTDFWQGAGVDRSLLGQALPRLEDTADELKAVAKQLGAPRSDIHLREDASETTVKSARLDDYRIVYFATHGLVAGDVKGLAEPALALSIPSVPTDLDDGLLTASEVAQLKLNADWVVLSACNTVAGDKPGAEALSGLARAFFYAGARALLVTHWAVDSGAATRLTSSTFDILQADPSLGRAEALRRAMIAYLSDTSAPRNAYPAIWGPFEIVGEGGGLR